MTMYVYGTGGEPRGYLFEMTIYGLDGTPLGRVLGARVHRFDGSYVGEWFHHMVVNRPDARPRTVPACAVPPPRAAVSPCAPRCPVAEYRSYPDAFDLLVSPVRADAFREAAE
jgi:hypothetical protein